MSEEIIETDSEYSESDLEDATEYSNLVYILPIIKYNNRDYVCYNYDLNNKKNFWISYRCRFRNYFDEKGAMIAIDNFLNDFKIPNTNVKPLYYGFTHDSSIIYFAYAVFELSSQESIDIIKTEISIETNVFKIMPASLYGKTGYHLQTPNFIKKEHARNIIRKMKNHLYQYDKEYFNNHIDEIFKEVYKIGMGL